MEMAKTTVIPVILLFSFLSLAMAQTEEDCLIDSESGSKYCYGIPAPNDSYYSVYNHAFCTPQDNAQTCYRNGTIYPHLIGPHCERELDTSLIYCNDSLDTNATLPHGTCHTTDFHYGGYQVCDEFTFLPPGWYLEMPGQYCSTKPMNVMLDQEVEPDTKTCYRTTQAGPLIAYDYADEMEFEIFSRFPYFNASAGYCITVSVNFTVCYGVSTPGYAVADDRYGDQSLCHTILHGQGYDLITRCFRPGSPYPKMTREGHCSRNFKDGILNCDANNNDGSDHGSCDTFGADIVCKGFDYLPPGDYKEYPDRYCENNVNNVCYLTESTRSDEASMTTEDTTELWISSTEESNTDKMTTKPTKLDLNVKIEAKHPKMTGWSSQSSLMVSPNLPKIFQHLFSTKELLYSYASNSFFGRLFGSL